MNRVPLELRTAEGAPIALDELAAGGREVPDDLAFELVRRARREGLALERDGLHLYGVGVAARLHAPAGFAVPHVARTALAFLRAIPAAGGQPLAVGALPFRNDVAASLVLPRLTLRCRPGEPAHLLALAPPPELGALLDAPLGGLAPLGPEEPHPDRFELVSVHPHEDFLELVAEATAAVRSGQLDKVVVAREVEVTANRPFQAADLLERLRALYPACATFSLEDFVGASPELLVRRSGSTVRSHPLAGTVARSGDPEEDRRLASSLFSSSKDRMEHRIVVDTITDELAKLAERVEAAAEPHLLELRNVVHLATSIEATLGEGGPGALELAYALHPTAAIGGWPRDAALEWIAAHEALERDRYAGPLGYMDASGDGEWWLGIRSALLDGSRARLIAGVGIVAGSEPESELAETQLKLQALLAAAVRP